MNVECLDLEFLCRAVRGGIRLTYVLFWGHTSADSSAIGKECLSQWYPAEFLAGDHRFPTAEHYMMFQKAMLFEDQAVAEQILGEPSPSAAKALGRTVRRFDRHVWEKSRFGIVVDGNQHKFSQNRALREFLLGTKGQILVEASPVDLVWGIGLAADDEQAKNPLAWAGLNLLGFALMQVRCALEGSPSDSTAEPDCAGACHAVPTESPGCSLSVERLDHLVLTVRDVGVACSFYERVLGMKVVSSCCGRQALAFGSQKINLHQQGEAVTLAPRNPTAGSGDLCFITSTPLTDVVAHLVASGVSILEGPIERAGARGSIMSVYFHDPDGNLVEVSNYQKSG